MEAICKPIKERLLERFNNARKIVGASWRQALAESDPFFNTLEGAGWMNQTTGAATKSTRISVDRIERVTLALEKVAGIQGSHI
ncbi:hypothetical protein ACN9ML_18520 [Dyadobacter endophyticus]|uniref:hypothetical protein n=1 Tax=Dyadobacter endophyticus TaxID=1749036 RepID=UPI003CEDD62F